MLKPGAPAARNLEVKKKKQKPEALSYRSAGCCCSPCRAWRRGRGVTAAALGGRGHLGGRRCPRRLIIKLHFGRGPGAEEVADFEALTFGLGVNPSG